MKILAIGGGSMGKRRLRDLTHLKRGDVLLFEPNADRCKEVAETFGVQAFTDFDSALAQKPDVITISTPPALHERYVETAVEKNLHVFAEVPFVLDQKLLEKIADKAPSYNRVLGISCTSRYYPAFRLIRELIQKNAVGKPLYFEYSLGNYLPDWHPYEDYRKFYAGDMKLGGAGLDMILHEMNAIQWWLGKVESVFGRLTKLSALEINGPDNHDCLLTFTSGCRGFFHHDVLEQGTQGRHLRLIGVAGTIEWHQNLPSVRYFDGRTNQAQQVDFENVSDWDTAVAASKEVSEVLARRSAQSGRIPSESAPQFTYESCYLREMRYFLDAVEGKHPYTMATFEEELHSVQVFHTIVRSSQEQRELKVGQG